MKRGWILILLVSLGLNLGLGWSAMKRSDGDGRPGFGRGGGFGSEISAADSVEWWKMMEKGSRRMSEHMDFEPELQKRFHEARMEMLPLVRETRLDAMAARARLHEACMQPELQEDVVRAAVTEMTAAQSRLDSLITETLIREMGLLTPEQRERYISRLGMRRGMPPGFDRGRGPGRGRRGGEGRDGKHEGGPYHEGG